MKGWINEKRREKISNYYKNKIKGVEILIDNVHDPHNIAAVARSADGLGIETINMYYSYEKFYDMKKKGKKSSSTANKWIKFNKVENLNSFISGKKKEGYLFIGTHIDRNSKKLDSFVFPQKCVIVFGSERNGISKEVQEICDEFIFIPMVGMVESYNISVAAAITMYELFKQRGEALLIRENKIDNKNIK